MEDAISSFLEEFGEPDFVAPLSDEMIDGYKDLPEILRVLWSRFGWCSFAKGLFWLTDPNHYASRILDWTEGFDPDDGDPWILFARTAFGEMFCDQAGIPCLIVHLQHFSLRPPCGARFLNRDRLIATSLMR